MSTLPEIEAAVKALPWGEQEQLYQLLGDRLAQASPQALKHPRPRVPGLHAGAWVVADDFAAPLPDEFWNSNDEFWLGKTQ